MNFGESIELGAGGAQLQLALRRKVLLFLLAIVIGSMLLRGALPG